jgi:hypothetical protein
MRRHDRASREVHVRDAVEGLQQPRRPPTPALPESTGGVTRANQRASWNSKRVYRKRPLKPKGDADGYRKTPKLLSGIMRSG